MLKLFNILIKILIYRYNKIKLYIYYNNLLYKLNKKN